MPEWAKAVETSAELVLEIGDALVGGGEFAGAVQQLLLQDRQAVAGVAQRVDLLAQRVDLAGPAGLVVFLAVLGEFGALKGVGEFSGVVGSGGGCCCGGGARQRGGVEQAIDAADAAGGAVAGFEFRAERRAGERRRALRAAPRSGPGSWSPGGGEGGPCPESIDNYGK